MSTHWTTQLLSNVKLFKWIQTADMKHVAAIKQENLLICFIWIIADGAIFVTSVYSLILNTLPVFVQLHLFILSFSCFQFLFSLLLEILRHIGDVAFKKFLSIFDALIYFLNHVHNTLSFLSHLVHVLLTYPAKLISNKFLSKINIWWLIATVL